MCGFVGTVGERGGAVGDPLAGALALLAARGPDGGGRARGRLGEHGVELGARLQLGDLQRLLGAACLR